MKKTHIFTALLALTGSLLAQPYGEKAYPHQNTQLSSGKRTNINPGFLLGGYRASGTSTDDNFYIDKTDDGGLFTTTATSFQRRYALRQPNTAGFTCAAGLMPVTNCAGVSVIEVSTGDYAVVGAYDKGMFFSYLNSSGVPTASRLFMFPSATVKVMKPLIAEDPASGEFFVCGSYDDGTQTIAYFFQLDASGGVTYADVQQFTGNLFEIRDMIASPYNAGRMAVVGVLNDNTNVFSRKGFFLEYDLSGSAFFNFRGYGQTASVGVDELNCIAEAPGYGYVVGGFSDVTGGADNDWFMQLSTTGTVQWCNIFSPSSPDNVNGVQAIVDVVEPVNSARYIYGASYSPTKGMVVMKLDGGSTTGAAWVGSGLTAFNEFEYTLTNLISSPIAMSSNFSGSADVGIHVYGRGQGFATTSGNHYLVEAYLNGEEACGPVRGSGGTTSGFAQTNFTGFGPTGGTALTPCNNFLVVDNLVSPPLLNNICSASSMGTGSNLRPAIATGLSGSENELVTLSLAPNPAADEARLHFYAQEGASNQIRLLSQLGQELKRFDAAAQSGEQELRIDLSDLPSGVYFLEASLNGKKQTLKLIHTAD